jgi:hypothetical protein
MDEAPILKSAEEVAVHAGHKILMAVDDNRVLIASDPQGILCQQLNLHIFIL